MIPKIIHWCWLSGDPIPESLELCMASWRKELPDYDFIHWDFKRFPKGTSKWVDEAFANKKYAFAADYIRLYALYNYGGIYLDMDVLVKQSYTPFLVLNTMLGWQSGYNHSQGLEVASFGVEKGSSWVKACLDTYENKSFIKEDGTFDMRTLPMRVFDTLVSLGYELCTVHSIGEAKIIESSQKIPVFEFDFFSPKSYISGRIRSTNRTISIHNFAGSWVGAKDASTLNVIKDIIWKKTGLADLEIKKRFKSFVTSLLKQK